MEQIARRPGNPNWQPGVSGNLNGRPPGVGVRNQFTAAFLSDLRDVWAAHGKDVMTRTAKLEPSVFFATCARILPKDVAVSIEQQYPGGLDATDIAILRAIKEAIPGADSMAPHEVLSYVANTLRAANAKVIGHTENPTNGATQKPA